MFCATSCEVLFLSLYELKIVLGGGKGGSSSLLNPKPCKP